MKKIIAVIVAIILIGLGGCSMMDWTVELTDRQIEILEEEGVTTEYSELTSYQKIMINKIEDMYEYLDKKYKDVEFTYVTYIRDDVFSTPHLVVYPTGGDKELDMVRVEVDEKSYTDDYACVVVRPYFNAIITEYVQEYFDSEEVRVYTDITDCEIEDISEIPTADYSEVVGSSNNIYIDSEICSEKEFIQFVEDFSNWMAENKYGSVTDFLLVNTELMDKVSQYNCNEFNGDEDVVRLFHSCIYSDDYSINMYEIGGDS